MIETNLNKIGSLLWIAFFLTSCGELDIKNIERRVEIESKVVGRYAINIERSQLKPYENTDRDYTIEFRSNKRFVLSRQVPFLADSIGRWRYVVGNGVAYLELNFDRYGQTQQALRDAGSIIIVYPQPRKGMKQIKELVFTRIFEP